MPKLKSNLSPCYYYWEIIGHIILALFLHKIFSLKTWPSTLLFGHRCVVISLCSSTLWTRRKQFFLFCSLYNVPPSRLASSLSQKWRVLFLKKTRDLKIIELFITWLSSQILICWRSDQPFLLLLLCRYSISLRLRQRQKVYLAAGKKSHRAVQEVQRLILMKKENPTLC